MSCALCWRAAGGGGGDQPSVSGGAPEGSSARYGGHGRGFCREGHSCRGPLGLTARYMVTRVRHRGLRGQGVGRGGGGSLRQGGLYRGL